MLTKITIKDFESHELSTINLSSGVNLLRGVSDAGKSSIIRAICVCAYNMWDEEMVQVGKKFAEIKVESNKGYVVVRRGGGKNEWITCQKTEDGKELKKDYEKIGKTVPDEVATILGMSKIDIGDVSDTPNVIFQLEKHFMLSEINGKKCSSNMIAQMMDSITGLGGVEELVKKISIDGLKAKKQITANKKVIRELADKLHDQKIIDDKKDKLDKCNVVLKSLKNKKKSLENAKSIHSNYANLLEKSSEIIKNINKFDVEKMSDLCSSLDEKCSKVKICSDLFNDYKLILTKESTIKEELISIPNINELDDLIKSVEQKIECLEKMVVLNNEHEKCLLKQESNKKGIADMENRLKSSEEQLLGFLKNNPNCPFCGSLLDKKIIEED